MKAELRAAGLDGRVVLGHHEQRARRDQPEGDLERGVQRQVAASTSKRHHRSAGANLVGAALVM
jgi:hypothetical protein